MRYSPIELPFGLPFENPHFAFPSLAPAEARAYSDWFHEQIPIRIGVLTDAVDSTPGFTNWQPDLSPISLDALGEWLAQHVTVRPTTDYERRRHLQRLPEFVVQEHDWTLTEETFSLCYDVGMYLAEVIVSNLVDFRWKIITKPKNHVYMNQPVLDGPGRPDMNPVQAVQVLAYGIADGSRDGSRLRKLYDLTTEAAEKYPEYRPK